MIILPRTLSLITTYQCTAACEHCCFDCSPKRRETIPAGRLRHLIDESIEIPSIRLIVFTGGECFLLRDTLDEMIARVRCHGLLVRCVTNGFWATSPRTADIRVRQLVDAGLQEINFSTGMFHARHVPPARIINGARACVEAGISTLINIEICEESDFDADAIMKHPDLKQYWERGQLLVQRNVWISANSEAKIHHKEEHSRFNSERTSGCETAMNVIGVTPSLSVVACCGLHLERIKPMHIGSVENKTLKQVLDEAPDDFLKIWLHVEGPERILQFVKQHKPDFNLPVQAYHPCESCLSLYRDGEAIDVLREHCREAQERITMLYLASITGNALSRKLSRECALSPADRKETGRMLLA